MPNEKFAILLISVIIAAGLSVWLGVYLAGASVSWTVILPLALGFALAVRLVFVRGGSDKD